MNVALSLDELRRAIGGALQETVYEPYDPQAEALLRRIAERLPDDLVDDVARLIRYARSNP